MTDLLTSLSSKVVIIAKAAKLIGNTDLVASISDLQNDLSGAKLDTADIKLELADLKTAYAALKEENRELKSQKQEDIDNPLAISPSGIYLDTNGKLFCTGCKDGQTQRRVHLAFRSASTSHVMYICPVCKTEYVHTDNVGLAKSLDLGSRRNRNREW